MPRTTPDTKAGREPKPSPKPTSVPLGACSANPRLRKTTCSEHLFLAFHFPAAGTLAHGNLILRLHSLLLPEPVTLLLQELPLFP